MQRSQVKMTQALFFPQEKKKKKRAITTFRLSTSLVASSNKERPLGSKCPVMTTGGSRKRSWFYHETLYPQRLWATHTHTQERKRKKKEKNLSVNIPHFDKPQGIDKQDIKCQSVWYTCRYDYLSSTPWVVWRLKTDLGNNHRKNNNHSQSNEHMCSRAEVPGF